MLVKAQMLAIVYWLKEVWVSVHAVHPVDHIWTGLRQSTGIRRSGLSTSCVQTVYGCNVMAIALAHSSSEYQLVHVRMAHVAFILNFFGHLLISSYSREKRHQALSAFPYCKRRKAGRGLGVRLAVSKVGVRQTCAQRTVLGAGLTDTIRQQ